MLRLSQWQLRITKPGQQVCPLGASLLHLQPITRPANTTAYSAW